MAIKWAQVIQKPEFLALSTEDQEETRRLYFDDIVAPQVDPADLETAWQVFDEDTKFVQPEEAPSFATRAVGAIPVLGPALQAAGALGVDPKETAEAAVPNVLKAPIERTGDLFANLVRFVDTLGEGGDESAAYAGSATTPGRMLGYGTAKAIDLIDYASSALKDPSELATVADPDASILERFAQDIESTADLGYEEQATWQGVKDNPITLPAYAFEKGVASLPDMAAAVGAAPAYLMARSYELAADRANNLGTGKPTSAQVTAAIPAAGAIVLSERIGGKAALGIGAGAVSAVKGIAGAAGKEAATEFAQEGAEYAYGTVGTGKYDPMENLDRAFAGAAAGGPTGGAIRGAVEGGAEVARRMGDVAAQAETAKGELAQDLDSTIPDPQRLIAQNETRTVTEREGDVRSEAAAQVDSLDFELEEMAPTPIQTEVAIPPSVAAHMKATGQEPESGIKTTGAGAAIAYNPEAVPTALELAGTELGAAQEIEEIVAAPPPVSNEEMQGMTVDEALGTLTEGHDAGTLRMTPEEFTALVEDVKERGIQKPITLESGIRPGQLTLTDGRHRLLAAKEAGLTAVPVQVDPETATVEDVPEVTLDEEGDIEYEPTPVPEVPVVPEPVQEAPRRPIPKATRPKEAPAVARARKEVTKTARAEQRRAVAEAAKQTKVEQERYQTVLERRQAKATEAPVTDSETGVVQRPSGKGIVRPEATNSRLAAKYKALGGKRNKDTGEWTFRTVDKRRLERAEKIFGESDVVAAPDVASSFKDYVSSRGLTGQKLDRDEMKAVRSAYRSSLQSQRGKVASSPADLSVNDSVIDSLRYSFQDKFLGLKRIEAKGRKTQKVGPYQAEELYHGRAAARVENIKTDYVDPVTSILSDHKIKLQDLNDYMHAVHAPEANAELKRRNPDRENNEALSGMSDEEAAKVVSQWEGNDGMQQASQFVRDLNDATADIYESEGLEPGDVIQEWRDTYKNYVPLHRAGKGGKASKGKGFSIRGRESKGRVGSEGQVVDIVAHSVQNHARAVVRAEKNRVGKSLLEFARANPDENFWKVDPVETVRRMDPDTGLVTAASDPSYQTADNVFMVKEDGKSHHITFNADNPVAEKLARAMKNLDADQSNKVLQGFQKLNRFLSAVNTSYNPEFVMSNFVRDLQTAAIKMEATEVKGLQKQVVKDIPKALKSVWSETRGGGKGEWAEYAKEFRMEGGKTGWIDATQDVEDQVRILESAVESTKGTYRHRATRTLKAAGKLIEDVNSTVENGVRLSAYVNARKKGLSKENAASLSKNLTVNFNRKGAAGPGMNAAYLFFNAGVQGSANVLGSLRSKRVQALAAGLVVASAGNALSNRVTGGEDEDGIPYYDKIGHWEKERNLIIMNPMSDIGDYYKIPLPYGYNIFKVMGDQIADAIDKPDYNVLESAGHVASALAGSFNPVGSDSTWLQFIAPTIVDPIAQISENQRFYGSPLMPENRYGADKADAELYFKSARTTSVAVAKALNELTGGSKYRSGVIDVSPETIDLWVDFVTGGTGRTVADTAGTIWDFLTGEERHTRRIPALRKFYSAEPDTWTPRTYFEYKKEIDTFHAELKDLAKSRDQAGLDAFKDDPRREMIEPLKAAESVLREAYKRRDSLEAAQPGGWEDGVKTVEERIEKVRKRIIVMYREAIHGIE